MKLYYHKTDGGAEYLTDTYIQAGKHKEGTFTDKTRYVVRIDGDIRKDAEMIRHGDTKKTCLTCNSTGWISKSECCLNCNPLGQHGNVEKG